MSCYEWEEGTIKLPSADYSRIKKGFITALSLAKHKEFDAANRLRDRILAEGKGKRGFNYWDKMWYGCEAVGVNYDTVSVMFSGRERGVGSKPKKLTKKAFGFPKATDTAFEFDDGGVYFNNKNKTVTWVVPENNHACERARESAEGKILFSLLRNVKWTARSGGTIVGNNEYNRDDHHAGGGGNYVVEEYSKKESERRAKASRYGTYGYGAYRNPY